jgi:hypothetical protein
MIPWFPKYDPLKSTVKTFQLETGKENISNYQNLLNERLTEEVAGNINMN